MKCINDFFLAMKGSTFWADAQKNTPPKSVAEEFFRGILAFYQLVVKKRPDIFTVEDKTVAKHLTEVRQVLTRLHAAASLTHLLTWSRAHVLTCTRSALAVARRSQDVCAGGKFPEGAQPPPRCLPHSNPPAQPRRCRS